MKGTLQNQAGICERVREPFWVIPSSVQGSLLVGLGRSYVMPGTELESAGGQLCARQASSPLYYLSGPT